MKCLRPLPLTMLWIASLGLSVIATRSLLRPLSIETTPSLTDSTERASSGFHRGQRPLLSGETVAVSTREALREADPLARIAGIAEILPSLTAENALEVLDAYRRVQGISGTGPDPAGELILLQVGRMAGLAALERDRPKDPASPKVPAQFDLVLRGLAGTDPNGALQYWRSLADGPFKSSLKSGLLTGLAENNAALARDFFATLPPADQVSQLPLLTRQINRQEGAGALQDWFNAVPEDPQHPAVKWTTFHAVAEALQEAPVANADFMARHAAKPYAASDIYNQYAVALTDAQPTTALDWATHLPAPEGTTLRTDTVNTVISRWTADDAGGVGDWLNAHPSSPHYDEVAARYARQMASFDQTAAIRWAATIREPGLRGAVSEGLEGAAGTAGQLP